MILSLSLTALTFLCAQDAPQLELAQVVANVQTATGLTTEATQAWQWQGTTERAGSSAEWSLSFDASGRFREEKSGDTGSTTAFDGVTMWERDWTDVPNVLVLGDREQELVSSWLFSSAWVFHSEVLHLSISTASTAELVVLDFSYGDVGLDGQIQIDTATWHPVAADYGLGDDRKILTYSDWQKLDLQMVAKVIQTKSKGEGEAREYQLTKASTATVHDEDFAPQLSPPKGTTFEPDVAPQLQVKRAPTGHLLVKPTVNGKDVGWFIFDSGAGVNCIANHLVEDLELDDAGQIQAQGVGGRQESKLFRADLLNLGPVTLENPILLGLDLEFLEQHLGDPIGGIIGYGLLARCVVELDAPNEKIALFDPKTYQLQGGQWVEALIYQRHPCVYGEVEGHKGIMKIDTGAAGKHALSMHYWPTKEWNLLADRPTTDSQAGGVGGMVKVKAGKLKTVTMAGREWTDLPCDFALENVGAFANRYTMANVGVTMLEDYRLILDYPHRRLSLADKP